MPRPRRPARSRRPRRSSVLRRLFAVGHQRVIVIWVLAGLGLGLPWLLQQPSVAATLSGWGIDSDGWQARVDQLGAAVGLGSRRETCVVNSVHDGDTIRATCAGRQVKVRLYCIDAPELSQRPWGQASRDHLRAILPATVTLRHVDTDRYGRTVGELLDPATGENVNRAMVRAGQAAVFSKYCSGFGYYRDQDAAAAADLGIWARPGDQQQPWRVRRG